MSEPFDEPPPHEPPPAMLQFIAGVGAWAVSWTALLVMQREFTLRSIVNVYDFGRFGSLVPLICVLAGMAWLTVSLRRDLKWRAFLPGVLCGIALSCLIPFGIALATCGAPQF